MLKLIRKIFGCWEEPDICWPNIEPVKEHECTVEPVQEESVDEPMYVKAEPGSDLIENVEPLNKGPFYNNGIAEEDIEAMVGPTNQEDQLVILTDEAAKEKNQIIADIIKAVTEEKMQSFISYTEQAMDDVTDSKYIFLKYRPVK